MKNSELTLAKTFVTSIYLCLRRVGRKGKICEVQYMLDF